MEFIPVKDISQLEPGSVIRRADSRIEYVVNYTDGKRTFASRVVEVTNDCEWEVMRKDKYSPQDFSKDEAHYRNSN